MVRRRKPDAERLLIQVRTLKKQAIAIEKQARNAALTMLSLQERAGEIKRVIAEIDRLVGR